MSQHGATPIPLFYLFEYSFNTVAMQRIQLGAVPVSWQYPVVLYAFENM
jgi:hypothetical protein